MSFPRCKSQIRSDLLISLRDYITPKTMPYAAELHFQGTELHLHRRALSVIRRSRPEDRQPPSLVYAEPGGNLTGTTTVFLRRIEDALQEASRVFDRFTPGAVATEYKSGSDPVTEADRQLDAVLRKALLRDGEGWLSEESVDDLARVGRKYVWIVDPLDGTREFVSGIPEFCVSIALVEGGKPLAAGILNPATRDFFLGALETGVTYNGKPAKASARTALEGAVVLASRSEVKRGEWKQFENAPFQVRPTGSVAYKLALVAAGLADATFTLSPKHEWDVAAGVTLVLSAGGNARLLNADEFRFNQKSPLLPGLIASGPGIYGKLTDLLAKHISSAI